jgi:hypothetical protein
MMEAAETQEESLDHHQGIPDRAKEPHHVVPGQPFKDASNDDFEEFEAEERLRIQAEYESVSVSDAFWAEFNLIWRVFKYVLKSWVVFPLKM